jgi:rod shape-determining protein MreC
VITAHGVVGKTVSVGESSTIVHMINDVNFRLGVRFQKSRHIGVLEPMSDQMGVVKEIPKTVDIEINEAVLTSGFSDIFPKGLPVGYVHKIQEIKNSIHKNVVIKFYVDINTLEEVFVVRKMK